MDRGARRGALDKEVKLPELGVVRISGLVVAFCRALARREATPSEKDGTPVWPESRGGTGWTPMMTKGTIRGSEDEEVRDVSALEGRSERDVVEGVSTDIVVLAVDDRRDGMGVAGRSSNDVVILSKSSSVSNVGECSAVVVVVVLVDVDDEDELRALNRYIKRYVKDDPVESSATDLPDDASESLLRA
jgi:hypothetical protein